MRTYLRFLNSHRLYTIIEILGISVALAFIIPLMSYVHDLWQVNHENRDYERIYTFTLYGDYLAGCFDQPEFLKEHIPEVEQTTLFSATRPADIKVGDESYSIELLLCDRDFFDFFPTRFLSGSREVLQDNTNALVSDSFARKIGYGKDAVGKHFILDNIEYTIEGIIADYDRSIMLPHDVVINIAGPTLQYYWKNPQRMHQKDFCFFKVKPHTDREALLQKIRAAARVNYAQMFGAASEKELEERIASYVKLFRYDEVTGKDCSSLTSTNKYIFNTVLILSLVLLLFAIFNYIALNVAMGTFRSKEMATRRLLGSTRGDILRKLMFESVGMTFVCFLLGWLLSYAIVPEINALFREYTLGFDVRVAVSGKILLLYFGLIVVVSVIAGLIPALILSRYQAIDVIKGTLRTRSKMVFSKVFIFIQCFVTLVLLVGSIVYTAQYRKMVRLPLGVDVEDVYWFYGPYAHHELDPCLEALRQLPCVEKVGYCDDRPGMSSGAVFLPVADGNRSIAYTDESGEPGNMEGTYASKLYCSREAFEAYGFKIVRDYHREGEKVAWLTESFVRDMQLDPDNMILPEELKARMGVTDVGGIIEDFRADYYQDWLAFVSVQEDWYESPVAYYKSFAIRTVGPHGAAEKAILDCMKQTLDAASGVYKEPHIKGFIPALNKDLLQSERASAIVISLFAALMLILSLLGLIGLSTWYVSLKEHDIAVRKVFGSTVSGETWKNIRAYVFVVLGACVAGIPVAYWLTQMLLASYVHRISLSPWIFLAAVVLIVGFSSCAVAVQTLRVTCQNPSGVLKKE